VIDWILAEKIAGYVAGSTDAAIPRADLAALAVESERRVTAYTGLEPVRPLPPPEGIGRREWVRTNIKGHAQPAGPGARARRRGSRPVKPAAKLALGVVVTTEVGSCSAISPRGCSGSTSWCCSTRRRTRARRGC